VVPITYRGGMSLEHRPVARTPRSPAAVPPGPSGPPGPAGATSGAPADPRPPDPGSPDPRPPVPGELRSGHRAPALAVALVCAVGVWATWFLFVASPTGRLLDAAAYDGAAYGRTRLWQVAEPVLEVISVPFIGGVLVATMLLALLRRRALLALQVAVLMGGANLTVQVLKYWVLDRPDLGLGDTLRNSLPSGHTAAAASVSAALVLVVPARLRPAAALLGAGYTTATGISTLVGGWHRPSDVVAAVLVVLGWAGVATAMGARTALAPAAVAPHRTAATVGLLTAAGAFATVLAGVALARTAAGLEAGLDSTADLLTAYGGGAAGVGATACLAFAVLLAMRAAADPRRR